MNMYAIYFYFIFFFLFFLFKKIQNFNLIEYFVLFKNSLPASFITHMKYIY